MTKREDEVLWRPATDEDLELLWYKNITTHPTDPRWVLWKEEYIGYNKSGMARTFAVVVNGEAVGEGTLLFSPDCEAVGGNLLLADGKSRTNVNALRIEKAYEGRGYISHLMHLMEAAARDMGYKTITIEVDEAEERNRAIYTHFGYTTYIGSTMESWNGKTSVVLAYEKSLEDLK